ncbi:phage shock envelope stress response protein PspM [Mycolicibacterium sp. XJ879]
MNPRSSRPEAWRSLLQRGLQSGIDTAAEWSDVLAEKLNAASDPRAKLLRKRRWALRLTLFFAVSSVFWIAVTAVVASWSTPAWVLFIPIPIAAGAAFLATLTFLRYRWLRREPLPPQRSRAARRLPPWGSAARQPMAALASSERGLFSLLGVMERGRMLPRDELRELTVAANQTATTMAATATEVVSMERAVRSAPQSRVHLGPTINAYTAQLHQGARQYNEMVDAAAQLVSAVNAGPMSRSPMSQQRYREQLSNATDRLSGWAQAFDELGQLRGA